MSSPRDKFATEFEQIGEEAAGEALFEMIGAAGMKVSEAATISGARGTLYNWKKGQAMGPVRFILAIARANQAASDVLLARIGGSREFLEAMKDPELRGLVARITRAWMDPNRRKDLRTGIDLGLRAEPSREADAASS